MEFRRDINGLRALAVLGVIIYHFCAANLTGGFAGVDVFFVISGYLMTSIIYRGLNTGRLDVIKFYIARGRRIIPALIAPCLFLLLVGWFFFLPTEYLALGKHVASSLAFISNFIYWKESGYFTAGSHEKWLLHTWSLSVEWQFYLIYPLAMLAIKKLVGLKNIRWVLVFAAIIGFILSVFASIHWPDGAFFLLPSRAWEMIMGGVIYTFPITFSSRQAKIVEGLGLVMILSAYIFLNEAEIWPGYLALLPVLGASFVIAANRQNSIYTNNNLAQWLGNISYSLYLWHWPVVVALSYWGKLEFLSYQVIGILTSVLLAKLSYQLIEQRMRTLVTPQWTFTWLTISFTGIGAGFLVIFNQGIISDIRPVSKSDKANFINEYNQKYLNLHTSHWIDKCNVANALNSRGTLITDDICTKKSGDGGVFLWGDSHAEALSFGLRKLLPHNIPFYQVTSSGCRPSINHDVKQKGNFKIACDYANELAIKKIAENKPKIVLVAQQKKHENTNWQEFASKLKSLGVEQVILVGPVPQWQPSLPITIANRHWGENASYISDAALDRDILHTDLLLKKASIEKNFSYISLINKLCHNTSCLARIPPSQALLLVDYGHLSEEGSFYVVKNIVLPNLVL